MLFVMDSCAYTPPPPPESWVLGSTNLLTGMASSAFSMAGPFFAFTPAKVNDGALLTAGSEGPTTASVTLDEQTANNEGHGIVIDFGAGNEKRVGRIKISCYANTHVVCDFVVQYFNGSTWVDAGSPVANGNVGYALRNVDCNADKSIVRRQWRIVIRNWVQLSSNIRIGEIEAYEWEPA